MKGNGADSTAGGPPCERARLQGCRSRWYQFWRRDWRRRTEPGGISRHRLPPLQQRWLRELRAVTEQGGCLAAGLRRLPPLHCSQRRQPRCRRAERSRSRAGSHPPRRRMAPCPGGPAQGRSGPAQPPLHRPRCPLPSQRLLCRPARPCPALSRWQPPARPLPAFPRRPGNSTSRR